ncbi:hypothetical protein [Aureliella helgolandensis]|uniref:Uncharacterized protein n=1 Tax=Aureliella helgolandensis TaxID=2527968 RepID=A0A518G497_9BACT|nr:hypothetical protein [Aureliella helgolandensis]QDV23417.1 hypothetical protein Q31a_17150 [Aureliella helgolandensis]
MTRVKESGDCKHSPKNRFVQNIAIVIETGKVSVTGVGENTVWRQAGGQEIVGEDAIHAAMKHVAAPKTVTVDHAITHGKVGATNGVTVMANGRKRRFCYVVEFTSTKGDKVASIQSY